MLERTEDGPPPDVGFSAMTGGSLRLRRIDPGGWCWESDGLGGWRREVVVGDGETAVDMVCWRIWRWLLRWVRCCLLCFVG
jgi:hypothetical protein